MRKQISFAIAAAMLGLAGFATLFADALAVIPAFAGDAVALIERLTSPSQRVELMAYAHVGQVIHLSTDQTMVLSYGGYMYPGNYYGWYDHDRNERE